MNVESKSVTNENACIFLISLLRFSTSEYIYAFSIKMLCLIKIFRHNLCEMEQKPKVFLVLCSFFSRFKDYCFHFRKCIRFTCSRFCIIPVKAHCGACMDWWIKDWHQKQCSLWLFSCSKEVTSCVSVEMWACPVWFLPVAAKNVKELAIRANHVSVRICAKP